MPPPSSPTPFGLVFRRHRCSAMVFLGRQKLKTLLSITRRRNRQWRPELGLLRPDKETPYMKLGHPVFDLPYTPFKPKGGSFRKYREPPKPKPPVSRDSDYYNEDNLPELRGKFRFEALGKFHKKGEIAEHETFHAAFGMHLVGWLKVRPTFMLGHLHGDVTALSYFRRWLEDKHLSSEAGAINQVRVFEVNTGIDRPLETNSLVAIKDRRKYGKRKIHLMMAMERAQVRRLQRQSALARQEREDFLDAHCVRNY